MLLRAESATTFFIYTVMTGNETKGPHRLLTCRDYKHFSPDAFLSDLPQELLGVTNHSDDVDVDTGYG